MGWVDESPGYYWTSAMVRYEEVHATGLGDDSTMNGLRVGASPIRVVEDITFAFDSPPTYDLVKTNSNVVGVYEFDNLEDLSKRELQEYNKTLGIMREWTIESVPPFELTINEDFSLPYFDIEFEETGEST